MKVDMNITYTNKDKQLLKEVIFKDCSTILEIRDFLEKKNLLVVGKHLIYTDKINSIVFTEIQ